MKHRISPLTKHARIQIAALAVLCLLGVGLTPARAGADAARVVKYSKEDIVPVRAEAPLLNTSSSSLRAKRFWTSRPATRNSGSLTARTTFATSIPRRLVSAPI